MIALPLITAQWLVCCFSDALPEFYNRTKVNVKNPSPEWSASFLSRLLFAWFDDLIKKGYTKPLGMNDIYDLSDDFEPGHLFDKFCKHWSYPLRTNALIPLLRNAWPRLLLATILQILAATFTLFSLFLMNRLLTWLAQEDLYWHGVVYSAAMFVSPSLQSLSTHQAEYITAVTAIQMKTALISALHRKSLKMSPLARTEFTTGQMVNMMSVDCESVVTYVSTAYKWLSVPLQIAISMYVIWLQLGVSSVAGILVMVSFIPVNGLIITRLKTTYSALMKAKDQRAKLMNEIITGIKVLKMYAWETSLSDQVKAIRSLEIVQLKKQLQYLAVICFTMGCAPLFVAMASFITYTLIDDNNVLDPSKIFVSLTVFFMIQKPLTSLSDLLNAAAAFSVARRRIDRFFRCDELDADDIGRKENGKTAIEMVDCEFSWGDRSEATLRKIDLNIAKRKLVAVVGTVGSGKSSLVSALLGEMGKTRGKVNISGSIAYVPQQAWILNATVKNNIIFTSSPDSARYEEVLDNCALKADLKILEAGDQTEIGEKGINLSGGQKQRVSLARAVYADRDIYLLDDTLSAVDSHVGKHIFDQVIGPKGVLKDKTRILVTHKVALLPQVDDIVVMKNGRISEQGSYTELVQRKGAFSEFLAEYLAEGAAGEDDLSEIKALVKNVPIAESRKIVQSSKVERKYDDNQDNLSTKGSLVEAESAETGSINRGVYLSYLQTIGAPLCVAILTLNVFLNIFVVAGNLSLKAWAADAAFPERLNDIHLRYSRMTMYGLFGASQAVIMYLGYLLTFLGALKASRILHNMMLDHILLAPMSFFDTTPCGRILNRFTKDIDNTDLVIRTVIIQFTMTIFTAIVTFLMIAIQTPYFLLPLAILGAVYVNVQGRYVTTSRQLRRLESNSRSPVFSHFAETVSGTTSIRAFQAEQYFNSECDRKVNINNATDLLSKTAARWLSIRLEFFGNLIVLMATFYAVYSKGEIDAAAVGLSLSYALTATNTVNMFVTASAELENNLVSVERCLEYTKTPTEAARDIESTRPDSSWPGKGEIQFQDYATRYRDGLDLVLKDLSFSVKPGEKVGIVGRTGAGKSSLTLALFRMVEPANGTIIVDGVDVSRIGLHSLRSGLTIIPQEPVLFTGTLRLNLDPFGDHADSELWRALQLAHLQQFVDSLGNGLDHDITEGGANLSVGQRQLVCLARALLRKSTILILDEATAAVDLETDDLIQKTIREEFSQCTTLTIAHRLNTILDYDKVLVMDQGTLAEYDSPNALLDNSKSIFHSLAKDAGLVGSRVTAQST
ncbi:Multidrug resistance-associated protein 1 [Halotydeus destructor]|nr:Multidrug resistance-associated protein 1 [Halotydeus destructor]